MLSQFKLKKRSKGVTLLELGIVLLVIGIVISGAYVAYDFFIKRARTTKTMIEMKDYRKGFESFHSVYGALPGDMTSASRRIDSTMIDGNGDGKIASETEQNAFWPHMSYSKMISKPSGGKYENTSTNVSPKVGVNLPRLQDSDDIAIGVIYNTPSGVRANSFILGGLDGRSVTTPRFSVEEAQIMDQKFDDNNPTSGGVMCGMGVQSGTITACSYIKASVQSDANIFIPFTPQTTDASNSCPAQSVQISQQLVANAPVIAANATVQYNCRDINPSYSGTYSLTCNPVKDSTNNVIGYSISTTSTSCSLKTCAVPTLSSISGAASIQSTAVQSGQYLSYTCNAGYATKSLCSPNLSTDAASFNPAPACTASPTGVAGNIPVYAPDAQTFKDSGRSFNDSGSTAYDIFSGNKIFGLFGSTSTSQHYIPKYNTQNAGVVPSSIYDNGTSVGIGTATPNSSAILDLSSTTKAFLPPRMTTTQMNAIAAPAKGMIVFNTTDNVLYHHNGTVWGAVNSIVPVAGATPVGTVAVWSSTTPPAGWVLVDGQTVTSSSNYPELCKVLNNGTACGGITKTVPDFRGYFLRGLDSNLILDKNNAQGSMAVGTARTLLSTQLSDNISHKHFLSHEYGSYSNLNNFGQYTQMNLNGFGNPRLDAIANSGGMESRPVNIAVNYIMKAESTTLTPTDVNNILSTMMSAVTNSTANSLVMFDATASKFASTNVYQKTTSGVTSVGVGTSTPEKSAVLELASTTQGFLPPRMTTTEMNAIPTPAIGMIVYTKDNGALQMWNGSGWAVITSPSTGPTASTVPTGTIVAWGSNTIPNGWLLLNGGTYSSATYPDLANALGCTIATCTLPDYRGMFLRGNGANGTNTAYYSGALGSTQLDDFKSHTHPYTINSRSIQLGGGSAINVLDPGTSGSTSYSSGSLAISPAGGTETRPVNIAVNYIIKAKNIALTKDDLSSFATNIFTGGQYGTANSLSMFDSTGAKFQSSGLSQVSNVLTYSPTGSTNLMSLSSAGILVKPTSSSAIALQVGDTGTGIANSNITGSTGLTNTLDFYVNTGKKMFIDASGNLTVTGGLTVNGGLTFNGTFSPNSMSVGAGGLTTTTLSVTGTSTLTSLTATGYSTLASLSATSIINSGTLTVNGASTLTGLLSANGGITTTNLTVTGTLNVPASSIVPSSLNTSGTLSVTGTSTLTGLLTANGGISTSTITSSGLLTATGGIKFGTTLPTASAGTVYYDTAKNSLQMYSTDGVNPGWFRVLTRKDIIAFTIGTFDICSTYSNGYNVTPSNGITAKSTDGCTNDGYQFITVTLPYSISNPVITATWNSQLNNWTLNNDVSQIFVVDVSSTQFKLAFFETSQTVQNVGINVVVMNPN